MLNPNFLRTRTQIWTFDENNNFPGRIFKFSSRTKFVTASHTTCTWHMSACARADTHTHTRTLPLLLLGNCPRGTESVTSPYQLCKCLKRGTRESNLGHRSIHWIRRGLLQFVGMSQIHFSRPICQLVWHHFLLLAAFFIIRGKFKCSWTEFWLQSLLAFDVSGSGNSVRTRVSRCSESHWIHPILRSIAFWWI